jgi:hypothetical protein
MLPRTTSRSQRSHERKGSATYILYQYGQEYNPEKKYSVPKRKSIGKVIPEQPGFMYPNESFSEFFLTQSYRKNFRRPTGVAV